MRLIPAGVRADTPGMDPVSAVSNLDVSNQISVLVAKKSLDEQSQEGAAAIALLQQAAQVQEQTQRPASGRLDVYA